jgi:branched-chain amino acid transport system permease protein
MIGAFLCFICATFLKLSVVPSLLVTMAGLGLLGVAVERIAYRPLRKAPRVSLIITTLGVGMLLENLTLALNPYPQHIPALVPDINWNFFGLTISLLQVVILVISIALMLVLDFIVRRTMVGMAMRAISWNKDVVAMIGVPVNRVIAVTFALGGALGGAAGFMYGLSYPVIDPYMGVMIGWKAFISAVVGGIGDIRGAMLGGYILGALEILVAAFLPSTYRDFVAFSLLVVLLIFKPYGIFGKPNPQKI